MINPDKLKQFMTAIDNNDCDTAKTIYEQIKTETILTYIDIQYFEALIARCQINKLTDLNQIRQILDDLKTKNNAFLCTHVLPLLIKLLDESDVEYCKDKNPKSYVFMKIRYLLNVLQHNPDQTSYNELKQLITNYKDFIDESSKNFILDTLQNINLEYFKEVKSLFEGGNVGNNSN